MDDIEIYNNGSIKLIRSKDGFVTSDNYEEFFVD